MRKLKWKQIGKHFIFYLVICLPMAWLEAHYWSDEPSSAKHIIGKGVFSAVFFTVIFGFVFRSDAASNFTNNKKQ